MSNFEYKKSLGQNFLQDQNIINKIASSLTTEEFKKLGYESGEDWANNFEQALSERNEEEAAENVALKFKNAIAAHASDAAEDFDLDEDLFEELEELLLALLLEVSLVVVEPPLGAVLELLSLLAEVLTLGSVSTSLTETDVPSFVDASIERLVVEDGVYELTLAS